MASIEEQEEETTSPGVDDPQLRAALDALERRQRSTQSHASNIEALLVKKKTPRP